MKYQKDIERFVENKTVFCGMDIHKAHWNLCFFSDGMVLERIQLPVQLNRLIGHTERYYQGASSVRFVYEAGFSGFHLYRQLTVSGYDCMITPPSRIPSLSDKVKTDKRDALKLAQMYAAGLLKAVYVPPISVESDRQVLRLRSNNQKKLSRVKTQINSHLYLNGHYWSKTMGNRWTQKYIAWLEGLEFQEPYLRFILKEYLTEYHFYRNQIAELTRHIREISRKEAYRIHFKRLVACKGIGLITAMTFLLELWDLSRFSSSGCFSSFLGFTPSQHSSGQHVRLGHITREGNAHVRRVLVESAWTVIRHDPILKDKYDRIRAKGTNGKKAIVAVARSLAIRLRRCLLDGESYQTGIC